MRITVNGQSREVAARLTVAGLIELLGINPRSVVVERNLNIIDRKVFNVEALENGDHIEIIRLVGGG